MFIMKIIRRIFTFEDTTVITRELKGIDRKVAFCVGSALTILTFYTALRGTFLPHIQRSMHLCLLSIVIFYWYPPKNKEPNSKPSLIDYVYIVATAFILIWTIYSVPRFLNRIPFYTQVITIDVFCGIALTYIALVIAKRTVGWTIVGITLFFIMYAFTGPYLPFMFKHKGMTLNRFIDIMYVSDMGFWSGLTGLSATILFMFISFGVFLQATKTDQIYMDICLALVGKKPGGPAKVAVLSSSAMGSISGSTIANVVTTGTLTIPLMKKTGYSAREAAAIETVASAGGQIMPPIMGMGAFIMAEILGIPYLHVLKISFLPALLFYSTLWFFIDFKAKKKNLKGINQEALPNLKESVVNGFHMFFPIILLVFLLLKGYTPFISGAVSTISIILFANFRKGTRINIKEIILTTEKCSLAMAQIAGVIACAVIIVQVINYTGLMIKSTSIILHFSGGSLAKTILIEAMISYVLGMGLPIAESYIILATLGAPALIELGVQPIAAHLMIFWFAQLATITPPVCMTAFAAAGIAKSSPMSTGFAALKLGFTFYVLPMLFIYSDILNITESLSVAILITLISMISFWMVTSAIEGYAIRRELGLLSRLGALAAGMIMFLSATRRYQFNIYMISLAFGIFTLFSIIKYRKLFAFKE